MKQVNGAVLWANLHLLFWLSLVPFVTAWMGENDFATVPVAAYGVVLLMASIAYAILAHLLVSLHGQDSLLATAFGRNGKGYISMVLYIAAIPLAFVATWLAGSLFVAVAIMWLIPDRRIERLISRVDL